MLDAEPFMFDNTWTYLTTTCVSKNDHGFCFGASGLPNLFLYQSQTVHSMLVRILFLARLAAVVVCIDLNTIIVFIHFSLMIDLYNQ